MNFPAAGVYSYEIDYAEGGGPLQLVMTAAGTVVAPAGVLTLTPITVAPQPAGQSQTFTVLAAEASGAVVPNLAVTLTITGVNPQQLSGTTDSADHASFTTLRLSARVEHARPQLSAANSRYSCSISRR